MFNTGKDILLKMKYKNRKKDKGLETYLKLEYKR